MKGKWMSLLALLVFSLFAICMMLVLLTGAGGYRRLSEAGDAAYTQSTAAQYLATRFHQGRDPQIREFEGCQALTFSEDIGSATYLTRVYVYDGWLMELFSTETARLSPSDGEKILPLSQFSLSRQEDVFTVTMDGNAVILSAREGREVPHGQ